MWQQYKRFEILQKQVLFFLGPTVCLEYWGTYGQMSIAAELLKRWGVKDINQGMKV